MPLQSLYKNIFEKTTDQIHQKVEKNVFQVCCQVTLCKPHRYKLILKSQSVIVQIGSMTYKQPHFHIFEFFCFLIFFERPSIKSGRLDLYELAFLSIVERFTI